MRHDPDPQHFKLEGIAFLPVNNTNIWPKRTHCHGASQGGKPLLRGRSAQGHKSVTDPPLGREFSTNLLRTSRRTLDCSRILDAGWPHIVSHLDASLDLATTAALSLLAQEANRSASPAHICSTLSPHLLNSATPYSTIIAITRTVTTTQRSCGKSSRSYQFNKKYQSPCSG